MILERFVYFIHQSNGWSWCSKLPLSALTRAWMPFLNACTVAYRQSAAAISLPRSRPASPSVAPWCLAWVGVPDTSQASSPMHGNHAGDKKKSKANQMLRLTGIKTLLLCCIALVKTIFWLFSKKFHNFWTQTDLFLKLCGFVSNHLSYKSWKNGVQILNFG